MCVSRFLHYTFKIHPCYSSLVLWIVFQSINTPNFVSTLLFMNVLVSNFGALMNEDVMNIHILFPLGIRL